MIYFGRYRKEQSSIADAERADVYADRSLKLQPGNAYAYVLRGALSLARYTLLKPSAVSADKRAELLQLLQDAENFLVRARKINSEDVGAAYNLALVYSWQENLPEAVKTSRQVLSQRDKLSLAMVRKYVPSLTLNLACYLALQVKSGTDGAEQDRLREEAVTVVLDGADFLRKTDASAFEALIKDADTELTAKDLKSLEPEQKKRIRAGLAGEQANFQLSMMANPAIGLPYGSVPRILLAWISTEAIRKKDPTLLLGDTLTSFMTELDLVPTGGRWGTIPRLRSQMQRLFSCTISCNYSDPQGGGVSGVNFLIADSYAMWWRPQQPDQVGLWQSHVTLGRKFYNEIIANSVPIDMRALKALRRSPLALDLYTWLTYRMSYLSRPTEIPWEALAAQFGADYTDLKHFKPEFRSALKKVLLQYPKARVGEGKFGVTLQPSPSHVKAIHK